MTVVEKMWLTIVVAIPAIASVLFTIDLLTFNDSKHEDFYLTKRFMVAVFIFLIATLVGLFIMLIACVWGLDLSSVVPNLAKLAREMP